jgi:hypothetical protein
VWPRVRGQRGQPLQFPHLLDLDVLAVGENEVTIGMGPFADLRAAPALAAPARRAEERPGEGQRGELPPDPGRPDEGVGMSHPARFDSPREKLHRRGLPPDRLKRHRPLPAG